MFENDNKNDHVDIAHESIDTFTDTEIEEQEGDMHATITALKKKLKTCEEERMRHLEELQRTRADFLNSKRRLEEQLERDRERATDKILKELLTLYDSFDTAMADKETWNQIDETWRAGVEAMYSKLLSILTAYHVSSINPLGSAFNPHEHEAVSNQEVSDKKDIDTVLAVLQKGFKRGDHIIRPARVVVGSI